MTPMVARQKLAAIEAGDEPPFSLLCLTTQDRLNYQSHQDSMLAHILKLRAIIEAYETRVKP